MSPAQACHVISVPAGIHPAAIDDPPVRKHVIPVQAWLGDSTNVVPRRVHSGSNKSSDKACEAGKLPKPNVGVRRGVKSRIDALVSPVDRFWFFLPGRVEKRKFSPYS